MKKIDSIDITKFVFSFFVIGLHTFYQTSNYISAIRLIAVLLRLAVPFFFITSGYFLFKKITLPLDESGKKRIFLYMKKIFKFYVIWFLIYLPIAIYGAVVGGSSVKEFVIYMTRKFLFVGEFYYSWNLWYLHGTILALIIIYILLKLKLKPIYILLFGFLTFIMGIYAEVLIDANTTNWLLDKYLMLFERVRSGIFIGFPYMSVGLYLSKYDIKQKTGLALFILGGIIYYLKYNIGLYLFAIGSFLSISKININIKNASFYREASTLIYFLHMIFIFTYLVILKLKYEPLVLFIFTSVCCFVFASIIIKLSNKYPVLQKIYK